MTLPSSPVLFLDQAWQLRDLLPPVGQACQDRGQLAPGLLLNWDHVHDEGVRAQAKDAKPLSPILGNPGATRYGREKVGQHKDAANWIQRPEPQKSAQWDQLMSDAVTAQASLGLPATILPTRQLSGPDWPDGVQAALDAVRRNGANVAGEVLAGLILNDVWITDQRMRRTLLNQFTDLPPQIGAAIHIHWSKAELTRQSGSLDSLRILVSALARDGRKVLLIESGCLGWLSIAWGAWGVSAGLPISSWSRSTEEIKGTKGQKRLKVARYFETDLLHHVRQPAHRRLSQEPGYTHCPCSFCADLEPDTTNSWDHNLAASHGLFALATLVEKVSAPRLQERRDRVRHILDEAIQFESELGSSLKADSRPLHLSVWRGAI